MTRELALGGVASLAIASLFASAEPAWEYAGETLWLEEGTRATITATNATVCEPCIGASRVVLVVDGVPVARSDARAHASVSVALHEPGPHRIEARCASEGARRAACSIVVQRSRQAS